MRILIAPPPKAANSWLKYVLVTIDDLDWLNGNETPKGTGPSAFTDWVAAGGFRNGSIFHHHYDYAEEFAHEVAAIPAHLVRSSAIRMTALSRSTISFRSKLPPTASQTTRSGEASERTRSLASRSIRRKR